MLSQPDSHLFWRALDSYSCALVLHEAHLAIDEHYCRNWMEPQLTGPCFSLSPASTEQSPQLPCPGVPGDLQPSPSNLQSSSPSLPSDHQPSSSSLRHQNQQVLSSWGGLTGNTNTPNNKKPPQPQPKQPRSPSLQRKNSRKGELSCKKKNTAKKGVMAISVSERLIDHL